MPKTLTDSFVNTLRERLGEGKPVRRRFPNWGGVYVDRPLPLCLVYRRPPARRDDGTPALVRPAPAHVLAAGDAASQDDLAEVLQAVAEVGREAHGAFAVVELWGTAEPGRCVEGEPETHRPEFRIHAPEDPALDETVGRLARALKHVAVGALAADVQVCCTDRPSPPDLAPLAKGVVPDDVPVLGLEVAPVYRSADGAQVYPYRLAHLGRAVERAVRETAFTFSCTRGDVRPPHFLALGRRHLEKAAREVDERLAAIDGAFEFLLQTTPVNAREAWEAFQACGYIEAPDFHYRPLNVDPERLKRELFDIPVEKVDDPALAGVFREKQEELDRQLTMLRDRGTRQFFFGSLALYGEVEPGLLRLAREILERLPGHDYDLQAPEHLGDEAFAERAAEELAYYHAGCTAFPEQAELRDDMPPSLMVSRGRLLVGRGARIPRARVDALLQHEVGTHLLTYFNGRAQPLRLLYAGLAGYEALQEGLAVLAEYLAGGLNVPRLRVLAARVVAAQRLIEGASFVSVFRLLCDEHGFAPYLAFTVTMRVFRGGGLVKDVIYLRGLHELLAHLRDGGALEPLLVGKIALHHRSLIEELHHREVLRPMPLRPRYLSYPHIDERLSRAREGLTFVDLIEQSLPCA